MTKKYFAKNNLGFEYNKSRQKLTELKLRGVKMIAADYDGTIFDRYDQEYNDPSKVIQLAFKLRQKGIEFAFVSGRNTTLELPLRELIPQFCKKYASNLTIWRSGGNGMNLNRITYTPNPKDIKVEEFYSNSITLKDIERALEVYLSFNINPDKKAQIFFQSFLEKQLPEDLVPSLFLKLSKPFGGKVFAESVKVTFVLPTSVKEQEKYIKLLKKTLEPHGLNVNWGRIPFADVSKKYKKNGKTVDGKLMMVNTIKNILKINDSQFATFGDAPNDNNTGLLSFPYSFTNDPNVIKKDKHSPPFILEVKNSPVASIYEAIQYLVAKKH